MADDLKTENSLDSSPYFSPDLAPTLSPNRTWKGRDMAVLWISMSACIPTYMLASSMIDRGMNWYQAILTILAGNLVVLLPILLNAHAGTKHGIAFPIYCRSAFGILGANIPAMLRALVGCGWFGIQTWIGGQAIYILICALVPRFAQSPLIAVLGINLAQLACFLFFWLLNVVIARRGIESVRLLLWIKAPLIVALGLIFLIWAYVAASGFGPLLSKPSAFIEGGTQQGNFWNVFFPSLAVVIGFWSTLSLNIPDFSRFCRSQRDQVLGQSLGLPISMTLFSCLGVVMTSATLVIFGKAIWDPVVIVSKFSNPIVLVVAMVALCIATLATNIAANIVGPAIDFANLYPRKISFRAGATIAGIVGILVQPWNLVADPSHYMELWLTGYSSLLGAIGGILIVDYYVLKRTELVVPELYVEESRYWYTGGFNLVAILAFSLGVAPCIPGFVAKLFPAVFVPRFWQGLYPYAWFVSFFIAAIVYFAGMAIYDRISHRARPA